MPRLTPANTYEVPRVKMKLFTFVQWINRPFTAPHAAPSTRPHAIAITTGVS